MKILLDIKEAIEELNQIKSGLTQGRDVDELINELNQQD